jgi:outer membrane protein OmpA-like peptidoglycan-associated protein
MKPIKLAVAAGLLAACASQPRRQVLVTAPPPEVRPVAVAPQPAPAAPIVVAPPGKTSVTIVDSKGEKAARRAANEAEAHAETTARRLEEQEQETAEAQRRAEEAERLRQDEAARAAELGAVSGEATAEARQRAEEAERLRQDEGARAAEAEARARSAEQEAATKSQALTEAEQQAAAEAAARQDAERRAGDVEREIAAITEVQRTERGLVVTLSGDVLFEFDRAEILPPAQEKLRALAATLSRAELGATIEGHTDAVGPASYNQDLSRRRAAAVRDYLVENGVPTEKLQVAGHGEARPVTANASAEGRAMNRRVEIVIDAPAVP